ncbi:MAG: DUF3131 domain-containing protein [Clostridiales bacterium]|nr:DUF3131 domain-containing protein [Clostridiales bacterium]
MDIKNFKNYLFIKALLIRRRLVSFYRRTYRDLKTGELPPEKELFLTEFYSVEKQLTVVLKELDSIKKLRLPSNADSVPRAASLADELKGIRPEPKAYSEKIASFSADGIMQAELEALPILLKIALFSELAELVSGGSFDETELTEKLLKLKTCSELKWDDLISEASPVERILRGDADFIKLDRASRQLAVSGAVRISAALRIAETDAAREAVRLAKDGEGRRASAAYYLAADGEDELTRALGKRRRMVKPKAAFCLFVAALIALTAAFEAVLIKRGTVTVILGLFPSFMIALSIATTGFGLLFRPRRVLRLSLKDAREYPTAVATPVLLFDEASVKSAARTLENHYLANELEGVRFILLGDLKDAPEKVLPGDEKIIEKAKEEIRALNSKYGDRFTLLLRERTKNRDGVWQGHERKRGAVTELLKVLSGGESTFNAYPEHRLRADYTVVLDADTVMPPGTLAKLIGAAAHPANAPVIGDGRVKAGYSVFVPRMRTTARSAAKSFFSGLFSGDTGCELYSQAVSNLHMDAYREGDFGGKGIINVRAFLRMTEGRIPDNTVLSHDLLEGSLARAAYLDDVTLLDSEPATLPKWWKRQERWIRGDWQLLPFIAGRLGKPLGSIAKAKMLANLLRSLREPVTLALLAASLVIGSVPLFVLALLSFIFEPVKGFFLLAASSMRERAARDAWLKLLLRTLVETAALPYAAVCSFKAVVKALVRTLFTHRKMLEWQTAASAEAGESGLAAANSAASFLTLSLLTVLTFLLGLKPLYILGAILAVLWAAAPPVIGLMGRERKPKALSDADRAFVFKLFMGAWKFFDETVGDKTNHLPPDNVQEFPEKPPADLTSPTDIGMGLMALISARDLGVLNEPDFFKRVTNMIDSIEKLEKWHGIPLNWYRVGDLTPIAPRFVSSVDAGNLAASLMVTAIALREAGAEDSAKRADGLFEAMELGRLYDHDKKLFSIGFDLDSGRLYGAHYDLYASEARLLSFVAIVKNEVPTDHWQALSRLLKDASGGRTLVSWSGTVFEYLMPLLFFETVPGSMQHEIALGAVRTQMMETSGGVPWGKSESGYYAFDRAMNYQYRAFGEAALALEPAREKHDVIAPYASSLALLLEPNEAADNLRNLVKSGAYGSMGLYEAMDMGSDGNPRFVRSFMAHHKGMELAAYAAVLTGNKNVSRFMSIPRVRSMEQLLFENLPLKPIVIREYESSVVGSVKTRDRSGAYVRKAASGTLDGALVSNGDMHTAMFSDGTGYSAIGNTMLTDRDGVRIFFGENSFREILGRAEFEPSEARFEAESCGIYAKLAVFDSASNNSEVRQMSFVNRSKEKKELTVGAFFRPVLVTEREFKAHPAFVKLTVDAAKEDNAVLFRLRKKRGRKELYLLAALIAKTETAYSSDAYSFPGRLTPYAEALSSRAPGEFRNSPAEPCFSAVAKTELSPGESAEMLFVMAAAGSREEAVRALRETASSVDAERKLVRAVANGMLKKSGVTAETIVKTEPLALRVAKGIPFKDKPNVQTKKGVAALWELGISGDRPIVLARVSKREQLIDVKRFLAFTRFSNARGLDFDAVILSRLPVSYGDPARKRLSELAADCAAVIDGAYVSEEQEAALNSMALIAADADKLPYYPPKRKEPHCERTVTTEKLPARKLAFMNGFGGFDPDADEYVIRTGAEPTPAPWANVIANENFGTLVTENGGGFTWYKNARLLRLTPWSCDPLSDPACEKVSLSEDGKVRFLMPYGKCGEYEISHGPGYTKSLSKAGDLLAELMVFADAERPLKYYLVTVKNQSRRVRKLKARLEITPAAGENANDESIVSAVSDGVMVFDSARRADDGARAFILGGDALFETGTERALTVPSGGEAQAVFILGMDEKTNISRYKKDLVHPEAAKRELKRAKEAWTERLGRLTVTTGDGAFDLLVNRILLYQLYASRLFARTGFYQSGGAVGFRDRLQDVSALLMTEPERARSAILDSAAHQFKEGDVLHWWHGDGRGVRTRISDDRLFLPFVCLEYERITGDGSIWDEDAPFLEGEPLKENERDKYAVFCAGDQRGSVFDHCVRAIRASMPRGENGLPLMGAGDWNDGYDDLYGESAFVGWFLYGILGDFSDIAEKRGENGLAAELSAFRDELKESLEKTWEDDRYLRAIGKDGTVLGSKKSKECRIDLISGVWAVFAGAEHAERAFDTALRELLDEENAVLKLLKPPFTDSSEKPVGYIEAYSEGLRENGGQYTHAAAWAVIAACMLNKPETAHRLLGVIDPVSHGSAVTVRKYRTEPYVLAADVGGAGDNLGRGGWTWYTGSAGWLYRAMTEHILGIKKTGDKLSLKPVTVFDSFELRYVFGTAVYRVRARRGEAAHLSVDGVRCDFIPLVSDGRTHEVEAVYQ